MKKRLLITILVVMSLFCLLAFSVSAASLSNFVDVKITLIDNTETIAYLNKGGTWEGYQGYDRVNLYKSYEDSSQTYDWSEVRVFDMRESQIHTFDGTTLTPTGTYPQTLLGYPANAPVNMTHVYYPQGAVIIASNSFSKSSNRCNSLEYLWIPKSVKIIAKDICNGVTTLETVEFEDGSQCHTIQDQAFTGCTSLSSINLEDTVLEIIGLEANSTSSTVAGAFRNCTSLTAVKFPETLKALGYNCFYLSGISGKVVLPNGVTNVYPGALLSTKIETLVFGDGPIEIGFNLVGAYGNVNGEYLKEIYIPAGATISSNGTQSPWYKCTNAVTFYVIGEVGEDCSATVSALKTSYDGNHMVIITEDEAKTATEGTYDGVIVLGYNKCEAFYGGVHTEDIDNDCTTDNLCKNCKRLETEATSHKIDTVIEYPNGFTMPGSRINGCVNPNCTIVDASTDTKAIFGALGYSVKDDNTAIDSGFTIETGAYSEYLALGNTLKLGIIILNPAYVTQGAELLDENGKLNSAKGFQMEINSTAYGTIDYYIRDFTRESAINELLICLYAIDGEGNAEFIQADNANSGTALVGTRHYKTISLKSLIGESQVALLPSKKENQ